MSLVETQESYFYNQKRVHKQQHRFRKHFDDPSLFGGGDKKRGAGFDTESVISASYRRRPSLSGLYRPGSAARRLSISHLQPQLQPPAAAAAGQAATLPVIDPTGPRLVTAVATSAGGGGGVGGANLEPVEERSVTNERKVGFLQAVEHKKQSKLLFEKQGYKLNEAKFASSSILSNLSKVLYVVAEREYPIEAVRNFSQNYQELTADTVVTKRKWQTDCYLDLEPRNRLPFLTGIPEEEELRANAEKAVGNVARKQDKERVKRVRMSQESKDKKKSTSVTSPERPQTARSIMSNYSFRSDASQGESMDDFGNDYDMLPAEFRPSILHYRRESAVPKMRNTLPRTRLEKFQVLKKASTAFTKPKKKAAFAKVSVKASAEKFVEEERPPPPGQQKQVLTTINFSMASTEVLDHGWVVTPSESEDPEANTIRIWDKQFKEFMRKREEGRLMARQRGEEGPLLVKFYNDPQIRSLRSKHQRSSTFPMPAVLSKLPPSLTSFALPTANEALMIGEGPRVLVLILPDGSGHCNYYSGRQAVCISRQGDGGKGLYTMVYEDTEAAALMAYFTPTGKACCYHHNGALHMLCTREGGSLFDEDGAVVRKWVWPPQGHKLSVSISIQLSAHLSFHCTALTGMVLRFSCRGQNHKFTVSPSPEDLDSHRVPVDHSQAPLLSDAPFCSDTALSQLHNRSSLNDPEAHSHRRKSKKGPSSTTLPSLMSEEDEDGSSALLAVDDKFARKLAGFKEKIHGVVNEWMHHYRKAIGLPDHMISSSAHSSSVSGTPSRGVSSRSRLVKSSMAFIGERPTHSRPPTRATSHHERSLTHPLPSPPPSSSSSSSEHHHQQQQHQRTRSPHSLSFSLPHTATAGLRDSSSPRNISPTLPPRPPSPLDFIQLPSSLELVPRPFKAGIGKARKKPTTTALWGCPVPSALHSMLLKNLEVIPPCKCEKRRPPFLSDLEYDIFLQSHVSKTQLVVVAVLTSLKESSLSCEPMLNAIHFALNRHRYSPCTQCAGDSYRLVKYDVSRSCRDLSLTAPLLVQRHNATPGMFLMYMGGHLVHADYMFNGYGTTKRDFLKQIQWCIGQARKNRFLPPDYKFTRKTGSKVVPKSNWAYPVSGVLQDLIPFSPDSESVYEAGSHASILQPSEVSLESSLDAESKLALEQSLRYSTGDVLQLSAFSGLDTASLSASLVSVGPRES